MSRTVTCSCGYVLRANSDEELYILVRRHIIPMDREIHHPVQRHAPVKRVRRAMGAVAPLYRIHA